MYVVGLVIHSCAHSVPYSVCLDLRCAPVALAGCTTFAWAGKKVLPRLLRSSAVAVAVSAAAAVVHWAG